MSTGTASDSDSSFHDALAESEPRSSGANRPIQFIAYTVDDDGMDHISDYQDVFMPTASLLGTELCLQVNDPSDDADRSRSSSSRSREDSGSHRLPVFESFRPDADRLQ